MDRQDLTRLVEAVSVNQAVDSLSRFLAPEMWDVLAGCLAPRRLEQGSVLIGQGTIDRTVFLVESGMLRVQYLKPDAELEIALLGPGSVVGEGAFFSNIPRNATVQATQPSVLWALTPVRFNELAKSDSASALTIAMALGAILSTRMLDISRKVSIT